MKSVSHSTHTRQVPFADGQLPLASGQAPLASGQVPLACGQLKEAERQLHMRGPTRPGTPLPAGPKAQSPSQVNLIFHASTAAYHHTDSAIPGFKGKTVVECRVERTEGGRT